MNKLVLIVLIMLNNVFASNLCKVRENYLNQDKKALSDLLGNSFTKPNIVLLGVEHFNYNFRTYTSIFDALAKLKIKPDCFLLESPTNDITSILFEELNNGNPNWKKLASHFGEDQIPLFQFFYQHGVSIYEVDEDVEYDNDLQWLNDRDALMAKKINNLYSNQKCTLALFPIGLLHILSKVPNRNNLSDLLSKERSFNMLKLGLVINGVMDKDSNDEYRIGSAWSLSQKILKYKDLQTIDDSSLLCHSLPELKKGFYALSPKGFSDMPVLIDSIYGAVGSLQDVSFWIHYTCNSSDCSKRNLNIEKHLKSLGHTFI